jgi:hypothetical protein
MTWKLDHGHGHGGDWDWGDEGNGGWNGGWQGAGPCGVGVLARSM